MVKVTTKTECSSSLKIKFSAKAHLEYVDHTLIQVCIIIYLFIYGRKFGLPSLVISSSPKKKSIVTSSGGTICGLRLR